MKNKLKILSFWLFFYPYFLFADGILSKLKDNVEEQVTDASSQLAGIVQIISGTLGVIWFIVCLGMYAVDPNRLKENLKGLIGIAVIIGVVFGLASAYA
ncbi:hypothetical protein FTT16_08385 [Campylobacter jejuni]|nr:hypothetical protein [Campylobacter jejuni]